MRNSVIYGTGDLLERFMMSLRGIGAAGRTNQVDTPDSHGDLVWTQGAQRFTFSLILHTRSDIDVEAITKGAAQRVGIPVVLAPYLSPRTRELLERSGLSYWDATGNLLLQNAEPFLFVRESGATRDPQPSSGARSLSSLKGRAASEVIVYLLRNRQAPSVRELARSTGIAPATVSRVTALLRSEEFLVPTGGGPITVADPIALATRWAEDYSFVKTFRAGRYFSLLGDEVALDRIRNSDLRYAVTGLAGASLFFGDRGMPVPLPASDLWLYTSDAQRLESIADLVPDRRGSILVAQTDLLDPGREGSGFAGGVHTAWPWRIVGDLLSVPGRVSAVGQQMAEIVNSEGLYPHE